VICYKINVLDELKKAGYSTYKLRQGKIFSEKTIQSFRKGELVSFASFDKLCTLLQCDIGDILVQLKQEQISGL